jgi:hypothetical protein
MTRGTYVKTVTPLLDTAFSKAGNIFMELGIITMCRGKTLVLPDQH